MPDLVDYGPTIADLERKRDEIERTIAMLRALSGISPVESRPRSEDGAPGDVQLTNRHFFGMKAPEAVLLYLDLVKQARGATKIASDLVDHGFTTTSEDPANTIRTVLRRLEINGDVVQVKREWGRRDWYPGLRGKGASANGATAPEPKKVTKKASPARPVPAAKKKARKTLPAKVFKRTANAYRAFVGEQMSQGLDMKAAAAAWRVKQAQEKKEKEKEG